MKAETRSDISNNPGCLYTGPTTVTYNTNGTMTVVSPWTKFTNTTATSGSTPSYCGSISALHSSAGATVPQLDSNLLYVQNVPADPADPNYSGTDSASLPSGFTCLGPDGVTALPDSNGSAGWSYGSVRYPRTGEVPASGFVNKHRSPRSGTPRRRRTAAATATCSSAATSASRRPPPARTTSGSPATSSTRTRTRTSSVSSARTRVMVWNPIKLDATSVLGGGNREIDAAILSVAHTFTVQNWNTSVGRGALTVFGSIAQKFRGPTGQSGGTTGYSKNYAYDPLLVSVSPPKFLAPSATTFVLIRYASVPLAFDSTGAAQ